MNTTNVSIRIPAHQAILMRRAAKQRGMKLTTWIRAAAAYCATEVLANVEADEKVRRAFEKMGLAPPPGYGPNG